jgi:hypothetical protein
MSNYVWIAKADFEYLTKEAKKQNYFMTNSCISNMKPIMVYEENKGDYIQLRMMPTKKVKK